MYKTVKEVDWPNWDPEIRATLMFVIQEGRILLMRKKRGIGAGKINGPGGKQEPGETPLECAIRETQEELCITPLQIRDVGQLHFQFTDGLSIYGHVFAAAEFEGTPTETDEADPMWCDLDAVPFDEMWEDDETWFPHMLSGQRFSAHYIFDGDKMLDSQIELIN